MVTPHHVAEGSLLTPIARLLEPPRVRVPMVGDPEVCNLTYQHATERLYWRQRPPTIAASSDVGWIDWPELGDNLAA